MDLAKEVAVQRRIRGWTQEDLAHRTGLSVRTIRNLELGVVQNPRRASVDLLMQVLGVRSRPVHSVNRSREVGKWRGVRPPTSPITDNRPAHEQLVRLVQTVRANRLTTFVGPAGVGKTRLALGAAVEVGSSFRDGIAFVELGDLPGEHVTGGSQAAEIVRRVRQVIGSDADRLLHSPAPGAQGLNLLLILDNTEHVPAGTIAVVRDLLSHSPGSHALVTARRRLTERLGANREIKPLSVEAQAEDGPLRAPAIEFVLLHAGVDSTGAAALLDDLPALAQLCRRLNGVPRYLEFAAERMRTLPLRHLLACGPSLDMLSTNDHALLPHQQSAAASIGWDVDLLSKAHRHLLERIAALPSATFSIDEVLTAYEPFPSSGVTTPLALMSELIDSTLVRRDGDDPHRYRLAPYVADFVREMIWGRPRRGKE